VTVIDGEVVEVSRRRERNAARTPEVLPPDVDTKVVAIRRLDSPEMQARAVTVMLSHARTGLLAAIAAHDLPQIVEFKRKAAAIQEIAKQVQLGKDLQLDAAEFVRRAERGLGVAIREGQERGEIATKRSAAKERWAKVHGDNIAPTPRVSDFAPDFFDNSHKGASIADFTDGVSDEAFEEAITEARAEGNLSRANVARKCKARAQRQENTGAKVEPSSPAPKWPFKNTPTEFLAEITGTLAASAENIKWITPGAVAPDDLAALTKQARDSWTRINKHLKEINRHVQA
jgi:hypothetical protein